MKRISRYEILGELGRGAMGIVYRAMDPVIGRTVAIKTIRLAEFPDPSEKERLRERLFREARSAGMLSHPNIVTIFDIGQEEGNAYIAMEFVSGMTLDQALRKKGALDRAELLAVLSESASALDYAHSRGIIHRDVKPGNIMLTETGMVKITDFGVAKILSQQVTLTEMVLGTPSYMSPEQIESKTLDGRSDQFALAVIAYEMLTGDKPFTADSLPSLLLKIVRLEPVPPQRLNPTLDESVGTVILKGMAKSRDERYSSCAGFVNALNESLIASPEWKPIPRGFSASLPTAATAPGWKAESTDPGTPAANLPAPAPDSAGPEKGKTPRLSPAESIASTEPVRGDAAPDARRKPRARVLEAQKPESKRAGRKAAMGVLAAAVLGVAGYAIWTFVLSDAGPPEPVAVRKDPGGEVKPPELPARKTEDPPPQVKPDPPLLPKAEAKAADAKPDVAEPKPRPARTGTVEPQSAIVDLVSTPPGARATVDDTTEGCTTPCSMELSAGRHVIRYALARHNPGSIAIVVPKENQASVRLELITGTLAIESNPTGAQILLNGQVHPKPAPDMLRIPPGKYKITLKKEGYRDQTREIEVAPGAITHIEMTMAPSQ